MLSPFEFFLVSSPPPPPPPPSSFLSSSLYSYNSVNGVPSCANKWLLRDLLRGTWNFSGYVTSDSGAVVDIVNTHHYVNSTTAAVAAALTATTDIESAPWPPNRPWATGSPYITYSKAAIDAGLMTEADLDLALEHALTLRFWLGLFDPIEDQPYWHVSPDVVQSPPHVALSQVRAGFVALFIIF